MTSSRLLIGITLSSLLSSALSENRYGKVERLGLFSLSQVFLDVALMSGPSRAPGEAGQPQPGSL